MVFPQPGQSRGIEQGHQRLHIGGGLLRQDTSARGGDRHHIQAGIEQGDGQGQGVVDPGINIQNHLANHSGDVLGVWGWVGVGCQPSS